ncbi:hypothetical protein G3A40_36085 [Paraburkholderia aspalathi]|uniref:hypothetical protein n=1 Tax=Paraburkholderia aspalathi TaxID=1324617 RepID=UPI00190C3C83|nr:hypothetical protein [Paraburkholderia aspalathi]MBK3865177.1 hypothetical protein [Paraburkholderia aspalathi]
MKTAFLIALLPALLVGCGEQPTPTQGSADTPHSALVTSRDTTQPMQAPAPLTAAQMGFGKKS